LSLGQLSDPSAVQRAAQEYDELGRNAFLDKYGFGKAHRYVLQIEGRPYDAKAVIGAAHGYQFPDLGPLSSADFASSQRTVKQKLELMGFEVRDLLSDAPELHTRPRMTVVASADETNWQLVRDSGAWGIRKGASSAIGKAKVLRAGDRIAVWISGTGFIALTELTESPQMPWPSGIPVPWDDGKEYVARLPLKVVEEFATPVSVPFEGSYAPALRISKTSLFSWTSLDDAQVERIRDLANGNVDAANPPSLVRYWMASHTPNTDYDDIEGRAYHFPLSIANAKQIDPGDVIVCYRTGNKAPDAQRVFGLARVGAVLATDDNHAYAVYDRFVRLSQAVALSEVGGDPRLNPVHSISAMSPVAVEELLSIAKLESIEDAPHVEDFDPRQSSTTAEEDAEVDLVPFASVSQQFAEALRQSGIVFGNRHEEVVRSFVVSLATKPFAILTGLSGSGKTRIALHFGQWLGPGRWELIAVRPDWMSGEEVFGYPDALDPEVNRAWFVPRVLHLILRAAADPGNPYLLILDEMNLAHVERYFGDFLSGIESRSPVVPDLVHGSDGRWRLRDPQSPLIPIPPNLFVVGTVNVDETTYMFSPKVLDRANTIEFRVETEDLDPFAQQPVETPLGNEAARKTFLAHCLDADLQLRGSSKSQEMLVAKLLALHSVLQEGGFEFGHRVMYEVLRFGALFEVAGGSYPEVLDVQILQKLMPKLHGSSRRLGPTIRRLATFCFDPESDPSSHQSFDPASVDPSLAVFPASFSKLLRMSRNLEAYQFTSFTD
jgi:hypothetical protein